jgi:uncharacterized integral membrane protein
MTNPVDSPQPGLASPPTPPPVQPSAGDGTPAPTASTSPVTPGPSTPTGAGAASRPAPGFNDKGKVDRTRVSGVWIGLIATALFIVVLVIFIAQNSHKAPVHFLGWHGHFSIALTILLSAVAGMLLVAIPGTVRILQLRRALQKNVPGGMSAVRAAKSEKKRRRK